MAVALLNGISRLEAESVADEGGSQCVASQV